MKRCHIIVCPSLNVSAKGHKFLGSVLDILFQQLCEEESHHSHSLCIHMSASSDASSLIVSRCPIISGHVKRCHIIVCPCLNVSAKRHRVPWQCPDVHLIADECRGVHSCSSLALTSAPFETRCFDGVQMSKSSGQVKWRLVTFCTFAFTSAPCDTSVLTISTCPFSARPHEAAGFHLPLILAFMSAPSDTSALAVVQMSMIEQPSEGASIHPVFFCIYISTK